MRSFSNVLRSAKGTSCALAAKQLLVCVRGGARGVDISGVSGADGISFLPNLVKATGVETLLRFPSSARFDEFPVHGKSFPLRKTMNCSLQVELSTDCNAEEEDEGDEDEEKGVPASGKWIEATATEFCGMPPRKNKQNKKNIGRREIEKKLNHSSEREEEGNSSKNKKIPI